MTRSSLARSAWHLVLRLAGYLLIAIGGLLAISPVPLGAVLIAVGMAILVPTDPHFRRFLNRQRDRWKWLDNLLDRLGHKAPARYGRYLRR